MSANSFRTLNDRAAVLNALVRAANHDAEKGDPDGLRDTREVAGMCGFSLSRTRRHLWALAEDGKIDAFDGEGNGMGNAILWRVATRQES
jgi:hypothetical protein